MSDFKKTAACIIFAVAIAIGIVSLVAVNSDPPQPEVIPPPDTQPVEEQKP